MKWLAAFISCMLLGAPALAREITPAERRDEPTRRLSACLRTRPFSRASPRDSKNGNPVLEFQPQADRLRASAGSRLAPLGSRLHPPALLHGTVVVSDGYKRRINFSIREDLGFIGIGWNTETCVDGLDRQYAFAPHCKQAAP